ncbi:hypothetical protein D1872_348080 [compost metagenome]
MINIAPGRHGFARFGKGQRGQTIVLRYDDIAACNMIGNVQIGALLASVHLDDLHAFAFAKHMIV